DKKGRTQQVEAKNQKKEGVEVVSRRSIARNGDDDVLDILGLDSSISAKVFNFGLNIESEKGHFKSVSSEDEGVTRVTTFIAITEDEPSVGKVDDRSEYTHVDLHYVEYQKKNLLSNFNDEHLDGIGGNTRDLDSIWEETEKNSTLHEFQYQKSIQWLETASLMRLAEDGVASIKQRRRDLYSDDVRNLVTATGRGRLKEDLESSTWRRRQDF
ncbi:hypothetical protein Tco_0661219, partial [Tanacetum coccineum]